MTNKPTVEERVRSIIKRLSCNSGELNDYVTKSIIELIATERKEAVEELLSKLKDCTNCNTVKISNPTPEGYEICPNCGDREMMDLEVIK